MSEFSQNGIISTLHDFGTRSTAEIEKDLLKFSKERKMELILPCLYSELGKCFTKYCRGNQQNKIFRSYYSWS